MEILAKTVEYFLSNRAIIFSLRHCKRSEFVRYRGRGRITSGGDLDGQRARDCSPDDALCEAFL